MPSPKFQDEGKQSDRYTEEKSEAGVSEWSNLQA